MTARRTVQFALLALLVAGALTSSACASTRTINQLLADPGRYRDDTVQLSGEVIDSYSLADRGAYQIDDGTGRLWVVSEHGVPRKSARVTVKGTVKSEIERQRALALARETNGVTQVIDQLQLR